MDRRAQDTAGGVDPPRPWASDFSYAYLRRMLTIAAGRFSVRPVSEAPPVGVKTEPVLLLRHDIDVSLPAALPIAKLEAELSLKATYMVMTTSPLYRVEAEASRASLRRLVESGHEIGLHFDSHEMDASGSSAGTLESAATAARERLAAAAGTPVRSISFHRPPPEMLRGPRMVAGCVNAYAADLMASYISDSRGQWRSGEPIVRLRSDDSPILQLLVHPIWWGESHSSAPDRLEVYFAEASAGLTVDERAALDRALTESVPGVRRRGAP